MDPGVENDARTVLGRYRRVIPQLAARDLPIVRISGGFSGAEILRVESPGQHWCLRRWPEQPLPEQRIDELHRWLRHLAQVGDLPVAVPEKTDSGEGLCSHQGWFWQLEPWLPGQADLLEQFTLPKLQAAMKCLARLHLVSEQYESRPQGRMWFGRSLEPSHSILDRLERLRSWHPERIRRARSLLQDLLSAREEYCRTALEILSQTERIRDRLLGQLMSVEHVQVPQFPCWRDLWHAHLLMAGDEVTGLIDPAHARRESAACDLSRLLGGIPMDETRWTTAISSYHQVRTLAPEELVLIPPLYESGLVLSGLNWIPRITRNDFTDPDRHLLNRLILLRNRIQELPTERSLAPCWIP